KEFMSEVRVFELAQELNMPAKDLLIKMRKVGIPVTGNFSELSSKQAEIVRKMGKSAKGIILPKPAKESGKVRLRSTEKKLETTDKVKTSKTTEKSKIVTISTISKLDDEEVVAIPKRRVRKKKDGASTFIRRLNISSC
ncbi:MAG: translation initiation factor IF-2 N-terminal domain-containing protein, partial [SAR324 cluster bacterium]|nr:translation initiation factor IF-2 N-terminal domain-containing protein [SAR324 cluster bacterium]